ncbi:MAG: hypothetical protein Q9166_006212 [cf. Caloplaca sp. 2 TL-2023]
MPGAKLVSSQSIKTTMKGGTTLAIHYAKQTTHWNRTFCSPELQAEFVAVAEAAMHTLPEGTTRVSMKESEHQSEMDKRFHFTAFCNDKDGNELPIKHFAKEKQTGEVVETTPEQGS